MIAVVRRHLVASTVRRGFAVWLVPVASVLSSPARADTQCAIHVVTDVTDSAWIRAAHDLAPPPSVPSSGTSCGSFSMRRLGESMELVLVTTDGRRAVRQLAEPFELAPPIDAMLIGFDSGPTAPSQGVVLDEDATRTSAMDRPAILPPLPSLKPTTNVLLGGSLGARVGGQLATPVVAAFGAMQSGYWELGVTGQWEVSYASVGAEAARAWSAAGFAAGVTLGRRQPLSSLLDLRLGISLAGAVLHQETHHQHPEQWLTRADARLGAYAGAVLPRRGLVRFRTDIGVDFVPNTGQTQAATPDIPSLPSWAASLSIGAETNGP